MPIFHLEPISETSGHPSWEATYLRESCWVNAPSEDAARLTVAMNSMRMVERTVGQDTPLSAWQVPALTVCRERDAPFAVIQGEVRTDDGRIFD